MQAAAFQNGCSTALARRVGPEARLTFAGESFVCGGVVAQAGAGTDEALIP